jgi:hypothetical protein
MADLIRLRAGAENGREIAKPIEHVNMGGAQWESPRPFKDRGPCRSGC